ncbi:MAG: folylpolyglutamate synthase/dihydrofolate synthase family protein [Eubacteriales bacterium]|nr:folylpolyglutamate synthase/dihydrofolate synthase family protein [Eubacteriales bacterium]
MNSQEAIDYIHSTYKFGSKLGLENIRKLMNRLGNPQNRLKFIHVAGTNGKGSTCVMLSYVLKKAGYRTGLFISPYLESFNERIQINNIHISDEDLAFCVSIVKDAIDDMIKEGENHPTEFEVVTATAMVYYSQKAVDIVVLEVGMGGRLDATNVIETPEVVVITSISNDHSEYLGDTLEKIAFEKASIIKANCDVVIYPQKDTVFGVIRDFAIDKSAVIHPVDIKDISVVSFGPFGQKLTYHNKSTNTGIKDFSLNLIGSHQAINCLTALKTIEVLIDKGYAIDSEQIIEALETVRFNGRMEILNQQPLIIIDGAHNADGLERLSENIASYFKNCIVHLFFGMLADKEISSSLKILLSHCSDVVTLTPDNPRAKSALDTAEMIKEISDIEVTVCDNIEQFIDYIQTGSNDVNLFCGSLYLIGCIRRLINNKNNLDK